MATAGEMGNVVELFEREDPQFLDALRAVNAYDQLSAFADRWKTDSRPWAREQIFEYLKWPMNCPGHQTVVKRLFKNAEERNDDELMADFLVSFDRLVRRERKKQFQYDWQTGRYWSDEILHTPRNTISQQSTRHVRNPSTGAKIEIPVQAPKDPRLFSYHTRYHLRRRAWRYFRKMGYQRTDAYARAIARALVQYQDQDFSAGEHILECWGLVQACFHHHDAIEFTPTYARVVAGKTLADLTAAPRFPKQWQTDASTEILLDVLRRANSRLVRVWSSQLLIQHHKERLGTIAIEILFELLNHDDEDVQALGAEILVTHQEIDQLPIEMWMRLLQVRNLMILELICQAMRQHVLPERLTLEECVQLACFEATSVSRMGFEFLQSRVIETPEDRFLLRRLAGTECETMAAEIARWALSIVGTDDDAIYDVDSVCYFFDSLTAGVREESWKWLVAPSRGYDDPVLWSRILETPFDDVRLRVVEELTRRAKLPGVADDDLTPVWCSVLLGVHRGGRQKAKAVRQIGDALQQNPERAGDLLPVLSVAIRSIRQPEFRAGLATIVATLMSRPELAGTVRQHLPELNLTVEENRG